jgi:alkylation response protein AidB-like acyl-CoA dehydrogenase
MQDAALIAYKRGAGLQPGPFVPTNVVAYALSLAGTEEQQKTVLPSLISGEESASWAICAPAGGVPNGAGVRARATRLGYELSGSATFVQYPDSSAWLLVTAVDGEGLSQFLVSPATAGICVAPHDSLDLSRQFAEVRFDGAEVASSAMVGVAGKAKDLVSQELATACVLTVAETVGAMNYDFELALQYAKHRIAFGRPIGSFQAIKHLLADTSLVLEMSKAITLAAAESVGASDGYGLEAASMAKAFVGDCGVDLAQNCFQVFGGIGFTWEHDQHLYLRRITMDSALLGDPVWHRERLCQLSGLKG